MKHVLNHFEFVLSLENSPNSGQAQDGFIREFGEFGEFPNPPR